MTFRKRFCVIIWCQQWCEESLGIAPFIIACNFFRVFSFFVVFDFREEDKNIFDYCRENNIEHVSKAISSKKVDVNTRDEEVGFFLYLYIL